MFLTESQKNYYTAMKKLGRKKPQKVVRRPTNEMHALFYDISLSRRYFSKCKRFGLTNQIVDDKI